jgi:hydroxymethylglutaryl-CoA lyase
MKIIECPRDAMQGIDINIPTAAKIKYLNALLEVGFDVLDCGSFVSPKAVPQMADTGEVLKKLDLKKTSTRLLVIVANPRGAEETANFKQVSYLGYPLSVSETFQKRNTNKTIAEAIQDLQEIQKISLKNKKELVVYLSMAFGNPYQDEYNTTILENLLREMVRLNVKTVSISDTIGAATPERVYMLFKILKGRFPLIEFGVHLHSSPSKAREKVDAAYRAGCRRFDGAIKGYGGCPFAEDELVGNIATEVLISYFEQQRVELKIDKSKFLKAFEIAGEVFPL